MKNIENTMLKTAIFMEVDRFKHLLYDLTGGETDDDFVGGTYITDGIYISDDALAKLQAYFDVNITSIHADDADTVGIWIVYRD